MTKQQTFEAPDPSELIARIVADLAVLGEVLATRPAAPPPPEPAIPKLMLTAEEAAEAIGLSRTAVFELIKTGELASVKIGSRRRVPLPVIQAYVDKVAAEQGVGAA